jgi:hypothetical protein
VRPAASLGFVGAVVTLNWYTWGDYMHWSGYSHHIAKADHSDDWVNKMLESRPPPTLQIV